MSAKEYDWNFIHKAWGKLIDEYSKHPSVKQNKTQMRIAFIENRIDTAPDIIGRIVIQIEKEKKP